MIHLEFLPSDEPLLSSLGLWDPDPGPWAPDYLRRIADELIQCVAWDPANRAREAERLLSRVDAALLGAGTTAV